MKILLAVALVFLSSAACACSCGRISSIDEAIAGSPILIEAQVSSFDEVTSAEYGTQRPDATLEVRRVLKGKVNPSVSIQFGLCFSSISLESLELGHIYVLPLHEAVDGKYTLLGCSHSGLELLNGKLYTHELIPGTIKHRLQLYMPYPEFLRAHGI